MTTPAVKFYDLKKLMFSRALDDSDGEPMSDTDETEAKSTCEGDLTRDIHEPSSPAFDGSSDFAIEEAEPELNLCSVELRDALADSRPAARGHDDQFNHTTQGSSDGRGIDGQGGGIVTADAFHITNWT